VTLKVFVTHRLSFLVESSFHYLDFTRFNSHGRLYQLQRECERDIHDVVKYLGRYLMLGEADARSNDVTGCDQVLVQA
jgi:hypothetical protein